MVVGNRLYIVLRAVKINNHKVNRMTSRSSSTIWTPPHATINNNTAHNIITTDYNTAHGTTQ
jgi:hypothetical protein